MEVITALRIVAEHLVKVTPAAIALLYKAIIYSFLIPFTNMHTCKAVVEKNSEGLEQKTVPQFLLMLYDHLKESSAVLKEIGVHSTSHLQLVCLMKLPLPSLLRCLQLFAS